MSHTVAAESLFIEKGPEFSLSSSRILFSSGSYVSNETRNRNNSYVALSKPSPNHTPYWSQSKMCTEKIHICHWLSGGIIFIGLHNIMIEVQSHVFYALTLTSERFRA